MNTKQVWKAYHQDIKQFLLFRIKNEEVVNDVLQDTFIKIHTKLNSLQDEQKLKSWVFTIARNTMMDYFRKHKIAIDFKEHHAPIEEVPKKHDEKDCLHSIIKNLPKKYRDPLFLSDIKGLKQQDIADQLELPLPTVKSQIQRARKQIAHGFMDCCGFEMNDEGHLVGEIQDKEDCKVCS